MGHGRPGWDNADPEHNRITWRQVVAVIVMMVAFAALALWSIYAK